MIQVVIIDQFAGPGPNQITGCPWAELLQMVHERPDLFEGPHKRQPIIKELPDDVKLAVRDQDVRMGVTVYRRNAAGRAEQWFCRWDS